MPLLAASFESLIVFAVILLLSAVANWVKNRKGSGPETWDEGEEESPARPLLPRSRPAPVEAPPPRPKPVFDLEAELRRLLGEESEPRPAPPPVLPRPVTEPHPAEVFFPVLPAPTAPVARTSPTRQAATATAADRAGLAASASAYIRSGGINRVALDRAEALRLAQPESRAGSSRDRRRAGSTDVASVLALLRQPATARQVILASAILSPPKGLEH